jgi:Uma2 family endonuclease
MTLEEMRAKKKELGYSYEHIADYSGVPLSTVQKVFSGATQSPRYDTLRAIEKVLLDSHPMVVKEAAIEYGRPIQKRQGEYTVSDYYAWPEEDRIELIDGVIYDMGAPSIIHQMILSRLSFHLQMHIAKNNGKCMVLQSPTDVQLDRDDKTMVQPDILVVCQRDRITKQNVYGAPDMVVEVLSKSTRKKDMSLKLHKYSNAGVLEYWIVDPENKMVLVYDLENDMEIAMYSFKDKVPVKIFNNECVVDFSEIEEYMEVQ